MPPPALYLIQANGKENGPFRLSELADADVGPDTLVRLSTTNKWWPAHELADVAELLEEQWEARDKAERKARRLPDPHIFGKLRLAILGINVIAGLFYGIGITALETALVLYFTTERAAFIPFAIGLPAATLGFILLLTEAGLVGALILNCVRIAKVLARGQHQDEGISWRDMLQAELDELPQAEEGGPVQPRPFGRGAVLATALALGIFIVALPVLLVFLVLYGPIGLAIYRIGYRLDIVVDRYRLNQHGVPWAPIGLGFFTALSGFLLLLGPFSAVFFVLLPIWVWRTASVGTAICLTDPARFVRYKKPVEAPTGPPPSPFG